MNCIRRHGTGFSWCRYRILKSQDQDQDAKNLSRDSLKAIRHWRVAIVANPCSRSEQ